MKTNRQIKHILISYIAHTVDSYQYFDFEDEASSLQHLSNDLTSWLDGTKNIEQYPNIDDESEPQCQTYLSQGLNNKENDFSCLKGAMSGIVGMYLGDKKSVTRKISNAYPEAKNTPEQLAEAQYHMKRLLCGYDTDLDFAGNSIYDFAVSLEPEVHKALTDRLQTEDASCQSSKLRHGLLNIINDHLQDPGNLAKTTILQEALTECENIREQDLKDQAYEQEQNHQERVAKARLVIAERKANPPAPKPRPSVKWGDESNQALHQTNDGTDISENRGKGVGKKVDRRWSVREGIENTPPAKSNQGLF